jgi:hypothetical protein
MKLIIFNSDIGYNEIEKLENKSENTVHGKIHWSVTLEKT